MAEVELDAPVKPRSILVLQGRKLTMEQVATFRKEIERAIALDLWPLVLNYDGPVYWVPVEEKLHEFTRWVVSLRAERRMLDVTMSDIVDAAEKALGGSA